MRLLPILSSLLPVSHAVNIILSNDDGWAELNIRTFYYSLTTAGNSVVISAPADNKSGTGSTDQPATPRTTPCEFNSCPANSPAQAYNASQPNFFYVNSYPATSMRYGIQTLSPIFFNSSRPDIAVAGPNVGANTGGTTLISGTVGAATEAAKEGYPAIAFSGTSGSQIAWTTIPVPNYSLVYADLSTNVTDTLVGTSKPYLPNGTWLNVNYPSVGNSGACSSTQNVRFVLSRINSAGSGTAKDVVTCNNNGRLPTESSVVSKTSGSTCYASISVGIATTKGDASAAQQAVVLGKLGGILSCLPA